MIVRIELGVLELDVEGLSSDTLDLRLEEAMRAKHREAFAHCVRARDSLETTQRSCPACSGTLVSKGLRQHVVMTVAGRVSVPLRRLVCTSCGIEHYAHGNLLPRGEKHTLPVIERALHLATELSYAKSSAQMRKFFGVQISHGQIHALAKREGERIGLELEKMTEDLYGLGLDPGEIVPRGAEDTLVIAIDGGMVPDRSTKAQFEAKVGVIYGLKAEVSKGRTALVDRVGYASLEDCEAFGRKLSVLALRHGLRSAGRILLIGDGAKWIRGLVRDFFPGAVYLLDLFHLKKRLREVLSEEADEALYEQIVAACLAGEPERAIQLLEQYEPTSQEKAELGRKLRYYLQANRKGIANYTRTDLFGSGSVEKAVDLLVSRRFKLRGMSWLRPGAAGMLKLRLLRFNGEWDAHWGKRICQTPGY